MGRKLKLGMRKKAPVKREVVEEPSSVATDEAVGETAPASPLKAGPSGTTPAVPPSPGKKMRALSARLLKLAAFKLRRSDRETNKALQAFQVAQRVRDSKLATLEKTKPTKKRKSAKGSSSKYLMEVGFVKEEFFIRRYQWTAALLAHSEHEKEHLEAELSVRDEKIAMLSRRLRAAKRKGRARRFWKC